MPGHQTFVSELLRIYHYRATPCADQSKLPSMKQVEYLCDVGLGPIAFRVYGELLQAADPSSFSILQGADLTTRVIYRQIENATIEILRELQVFGITPILLKGISSSYEFYNPSYLRLMGDVDIMVKDSEVSCTLATASRLGYELVNKDAWSHYSRHRHHHLPAIRNARTGVTIEIHTHLFSPSTPFATETVFQCDNVNNQSVEFEYSGCRALRFTPEFQLIFTIAKWSVDNDWALNLTSINDTAHILRQYKDKLDWSMLSNWLASNTWLYPSSAVLICYLERSDIITVPQCMRDALATSARCEQPITKRLLMRLLHDYPFNSHGTNHGDYAMWRAHSVWRQLTSPDISDLRLPIVILHTALKSIHHGKYNPLSLVLSIFRKLRVRLNMNSS